MFSSGVLRARMLGATPTSVKISMLRWLSTCALGSREVSAYRDTSSVSTPNCDSSIDAVRPAPPPPTMSTGTVMSLVTMSFLLNTVVQRARPPQQLERGGDPAEVADGGGVDVGHGGTEEHVTGVDGARHDAPDGTDPIAYQATLVAQAFIA